MSAVHIILICFIPFTGTMNSINWPAPDVWVFIAQLVEHRSANADAMGSNPVEAPKTFFGLTLWLLKSQSQLRWSTNYLLFRRDAEVSSYQKLRYSSDLSLLFTYFLSRFRFAAVFQLVQPICLIDPCFVFSVSDVYLDFSLRLEDSEAEEENDEWWVVRQVGKLNNLWLQIDCIKIVLTCCIIHLFFKGQGINSFVFILCS